MMNTNSNFAQGTSNNSQANKPQTFKEICDDVATACNNLKKTACAKLNARYAEVKKAAIANVKNVAKHPIRTVSRIIHSVFNLAVNLSIIVIAALMMYEFYQDNTEFVTQAVAWTKNIIDSAMASGNRVGEFMMALPTTIANLFG